MAYTTGFYLIYWYYVAWSFSWFFYLLILEDSCSTIHLVTLSGLLHAICKFLNLCALLCMATLFIKHPVRWRSLLDIFLGGRGERENKIPYSNFNLQVEVQVRKLYCINRSVPNLPINIEDAARSETEFEKAELVSLF